MKDTSELTRQNFCNCLYQAFACEGKSAEQCDELTSKYEKLTDVGMSPDGAFGVVYGAYGSCNARDMLNQATRFIHDSLDSMNKFSPKIKTSSTTRFSDLVKRFNSNLDKCGGISVNGVSLDAEEIKKLHLPVPANVKVESFASEQSSKAKGLALEITK